MGFHVANKKEKVPIIRFLAIHIFKMTSETLLKKVSEGGITLPRGSRGRAQNGLGLIVIIATWIYLYFHTVPSLYDGIWEFLFSTARRAIVEEGTEST